jgi:hypothetical protein
MINRRIRLMIITAAALQSALRLVIDDYLKYNPTIFLAERS